MTSSSSKTIRTASSSSGASSGSVLAQMRSVAAMRPRRGLRPPRRPRPPVPVWSISIGPEGGIAPAGACSAAGAGPGWTDGPPVAGSRPPLGPRIRGPGLLPADPATLARAAQAASSTRSSMDRASDYGSEGCGFDSRRVHQESPGQRGFSGSRLKPSQPRENLLRTKGFSGRFQGAGEA
jgi:hypothetical protein